MKKHDILSHIRIEKLIFGGSWLATAPDGRRIIISWGGIPESIVDVRVLRIRKNHIEAQVVQTVQKSPLEQPIPEAWQLYGGCKWLPIPYKTQLTIKEEQVHEAFHSLLKHHPTSISTDIQFHPIIASSQSEHYRNKVEFSWGKYISAREGVHDEYRFGFHVAGAFDRIENCRYCVLADDEMNALFRDIDTIARVSRFSTYDPKQQEGFWRHLVIRKAHQTQEIMLIFSVNSHYNTDIADFFTIIVQELTEKYKNIASIYFMSNTGKADIVQWDLTLLFGKPSITEELLWLSFAIQPKSFFQVNTLAAEKLYQCAIDMIQHKGWILLDLYAGTGTIGMLLSPYFWHVYSVELIASAIEDGKENVRTNNIKNMTFVHAKVEEFARDFQERADTIIIDPPRDGMHPATIPPLLDFGAQEIVYVSCNPATLVRDIELLLASGKYLLTDVTPVDMFPHTHHIETVVRLELAPPAEKE